MIAFLAKLIPGPYRAAAILIAAVVLFSAGVTAGYQVRDYFADRKEIKALKAQLEQRDKDVAQWKKDAGEQRARAVEAEFKRQDNKQQATTQSSSVDMSKLTKMIEGKCNAKTNTCSCEHTDVCQWLQLNAAYDGAAPPAQCTNRMPDSLQDQ